MFHNHIAQLAILPTGIDNYALPVSNLQQLEATAICANIGGRPVKLVAVYLSPLRSLLDADLSECFGGGKPVFLAGDLNAKHREWNSRVNSPRGVLLRDFATANSCFVHGPDVPTTVPSCPTHTPDVLDIVVVKDFLLPVNLTVRSALSSDHFPVIVDLRGRSSFHTLPDRPSFE